MLKRGRRIWGGALLACVTIAAYLPSLRGGFIWDDNTFLTQNRLIRAPDGLYRFWFTTQAADYFPATYSPLWLEWRLWGMNAAGYHAVNLGLHVITALLLWAVLTRLGIRGAYLAAFVFAVHPVNVESVAWITQRKNLMALLFLLLSVLAFARTGIADGARWRRPPYVLSLALFALAMLSKGSAAMLPIILAGLVAWRRPLRARDLALLAPFFAISAALVITDIWFQKHGSGEVFRNAGPLARLLGAGGVVWFYLSKSLLPLHLLFIYPQWDVRPADPLWWIPLLAAAGLTAVLWRLRRGAARPVLFAWAYFCVALVPVLGFTDVQFMQYSLVADHYCQIALIGVVALVCAGWARWSASAAARWLPGPAAAALVAVLSLLTWRQCGTYASAETIYRATLAGNPSCWLAENNLGNILYGEGRVAEAIGHYEAAIRLKPDLFEAQNDLGLALASTGRYREAIPHFEKAIRIHSDNGAVYYNAATALASLGRLPEALAYFGRSLELTPGFAPAHQDLGATLAQMGRLPEAIGQYREALRINPAYFEAHANLGFALAQLGLLADARAELEAALTIQPASAPVREALARLPRTN